LPPIWLAAGTIAVTWVGDTKVVVNGVLSRFTRAPDPKPLPVIVTVAGEVPALNEYGEMDITSGTGLSTVRLTEFEAPPPGAGFVTTTA
jgi:hypothetical protein